MVQRKVAEKLGIQADNFKTEKRFSQLQDSKNMRGPEMKKKTMKKTRSIKLSDVESLKKKPSPSRKPVLQPGEPPPPVEVTKTPQKQPLGRVLADRSPNYMKGTSSSEARKESLLQMSSARNNNVQSDSDTKILRRRSLQSGGDKQTRSLTRTSSLKIARTLTKTHSFKKCSRVALCADMDTQRATCSSSLKDSKFPEYLMLNPGGTEAEGTSVLKVCPYTYCSLNGHLHKQIPPLKCFISARRRVLKTQRSMKTEASSPRKARLSDHHASKEKADDEEAIGKSRPSPIIVAKNTDSFVEIYVENKKCYSEIDGGSMDENCDGSRDVAGESESPTGFSYEGEGEATEKDISENQVAESLSDGAPRSEIDFEDNCGEYSDMFSTFTETRETSPKQEQVEDVGSIDEADGTLEINDMEWEEAGSYSSKADAEWAGPNIENLQEGDSVEPTVDVSDYCEVYLVDYISQDVLETEHSYYGTQSESSDFEMDATDEDPDDSSSQNQLDDATEEAEATEEGQDAEASFVNAATISRTVEAAIAEAMATNEEFQANGARDRKNDSPETETQQESPNENSSPEEIGAAERSESSEDAAVESLPAVTQLDYALEGQQEALVLENHNLLENAQDEARHLRTASSIDPEEQGKAITCGSVQEEDNSNEFDKIDEEGQAESGTTEASLTTADERSPKSSGMFSRSRKYPNQEQQDTSSPLEWMIKRNRPVEDFEDSRTFNPREPNYLPSIPEPDPEKVDLRHQEMDNRKNSEEWMVDYALQQAVTKLAPAKKRKVALLVEAFETVIPIPKFQTHTRQTPAAFAHGRPIQACN